MDAQQFNGTTPSLNALSFVSNVSWFKSLLLFSLIFLSFGIAAQEALSDLEIKDPVIMRLYEKSGPYANFDPQFEVIEKRTETSKTFQSGENEFVGLYTAGPIHYQESGVWKTSSNEIIPSNYEGYDFMNVHNQIKTYYGKISEGVHFKAGSKQSTLSFEGYSYYSEDKQKLSDIASYPKRTSPHLSSVNNIVEYEVGNDSRLFVEQRTGCVKTAVQIDNSDFGIDTVGYVGFSEVISFEEEVFISENYPKLGKVVFVNASNELIYAYGNLEYFSLADHKSYSGDYKVEQIDSKTYRLVMLVPLRWLNNPNTAYPIVVDPTGTFVPNNANFWTESVEEDCNDNENINGDFKVGCRDETWPYDNELWNGIVKFNLTGLAAGIPCDVNLRLYQYGYHSEGSVNRFNIGDADLDPTLTTTWCADLAAINSMTYKFAGWNVFAASGTGCTGCNGYYDYVESGNNQWHDFNVSPNNYYSLRNRVAFHAGDYMCFGFDYYDDPTGSGGDDSNWIEFRGHTSGNRPQLIITYTNNPAAGTAPATGVAPATSNTWYNYGYQGADLNLSGICYQGYYTNSNTSVSTTGQWSSAGAPSDASGWVGGTVADDYHTVRSVRKGFPCGHYRLTAGSDGDGYRLYINGSQVSSPWIGMLGSNDIVEIRHIESTGSSYHTLTIAAEPVSLQSSICGTTVVVGSSATVSFVSTVSGDALNPSTYTWSTTGGSVSNAGPGNFPSITWTAPNTTGGPYTITGTFQDDCGNTYSATCQVTVAAPSCTYIYVSPSGTDNAGCGGPGNPCRTLTGSNGALSKLTVTDNYIRMESGSYSETGVVNLVTDLIIEGRYFRNGSVWTKSSNTVSSTTLTMSGTETISNDIAHVVGFKAVNADDWKLIDLNITTSNASGRTTSGNGKSNYGIYLNGADGYEISRCLITSGNATGGYGRNISTSQFDGSNGSQGASGSNGQSVSGSDNTSGNGGAGGTGGTGGANAPRVGGSAPSGGGGGGGGEGGGGDGGINCDNSGGGGGGGGSSGNSTAGGGRDRATNDGGGGGGYAGGNASNGYQGNGGGSNSGTQGDGGQGGGPGGVGGDGSGQNGTAGTTNTGQGGGGGGGNDQDGNGTPSPYGGVGGNGGSGSNGAAAAATTAHVFGTYFTPSYGHDGNPGVAGGGGGGGGAGGCDDDGNDSGGSGGGGGGGGGGAGGAGAGGRGGGSSFGIWSRNSTGSVVGCSINTGSAGSGGTGGNGGSGASGNSGGSRGNTDSDQGNRGGNGGTGGSGGNGSAGTSGNAGVNEAIRVSSGSNPTLTSISPAITVNSSTSGGSVPNSPVVTLNYDNTKICANSILEIEKTGSNWDALPSNWSFVKYNNTSTASQFGVTSTPAEITTTNTSGSYDLGTTGADFPSYLTIRDARSAPVITLQANDGSALSPYTICEGGNIKLTASTSGTNELEYNWEVYSGTSAPNKGAATSPVYSSNSQSPVTSAFNTAGTYIVRYQVRDECCGWSIPVFTTFTVNPDPTAPTDITFSSANPLCEGSSIVVTGASGATNGVTPYSYEWDVETPSTPYDNVYSGTLPNFSAEAGDNKVTVRIVANALLGCDASADYEEVVLGESNSIAAASISGGGTYCDGDNVILTANGATLGTGANYEWYTGSCGGTPVASTASSTYSFTSSGSGSTTYYVRLEGNCNTTACANQVVTLDSPPTAYAGPDKSICIGEVVTMGATAPGAGTGTWSWPSGSPTLQNSTTINQNDAQLHFPAGGTFTGTWTVVNGACTVTDDVDVTINEPTVVIPSDGTGSCFSTGAANWTHVMDASDEVIASFNDNGEVLGQVDVNVYYHGGAAQLVNSAAGTSCAQVAVMNRSFVINTQNVPSGNVSLRLYFTDTELANLMAAATASVCQEDEVSGIGSLHVTQVHGATNEDGVFDPNDGTVILHTTTNGGTGNSSWGANWIEFDVTQFSEFWIHGTPNGSPLPVELQDYKLSCSEGANQVISWTTVSETNADQFIIERSFDGLDWDAIGYVSAAGNSTQTIEYEYVDPSSPANMDVYYRLSQVDFDGNSKVYPAMKNNCKSETGGVTVYPNPTTDGNFVVELTMDHSVEGARLLLHDVRGRLITGKTVDLKEGVQRVKFTNDNYESGTYYISVMDDEDKIFDPIKINIIGNSK
ncbi:MAG: T9SS type A sorting domain-containing protein [Flavobacteriales bacterium]|nr:T9SS type A sorting domain-containing protein [Flavobacteriales bacterium]